MGEVRGYRTYRGRGSKWKILLAVLLVLVILVSLAVIYLQRYLVYDESGQPRLELPWQTEEAQQQPEEPAVDMDLMIQPAAKEEEADTPLRGQLLSAAPLTAEALAAGEDANAVAVTLKDAAGSVFFDTSGAVSGAVSAAADTASALAELTAGGTYTIARLSCFLDPKAANQDVENMGLKNTGGYIFYDGNNCQWLDPGKSEARQYLCGLAREIAALGFDEILLTDLGYPTEGKINKIAYTGEMEEQVALFLQELRTALETYEVKLSVELPAQVITDGADATAGLYLEKLAPLADRVYAVTTPEQAETLSEAVSAAGGAFVPELTAYSDAVSGDQLILGE